MYEFKYALIFINNVCILSYTCVSCKKRLPFLVRIVHFLKCVHLCIHIYNGFSVSVIINSDHFLKDNHKLINT